MMGGQGEGVGLKMERWVICSKVKIGREGNLFQSNFGATKAT